MKKIYTAPSVEVVLIRPSHMIMGSLNPEKGTGSVTEEFVPEGTTVRLTATLVAGLMTICITTNSV